MIKNHGEKRKGAMMLVWYGRNLIALDGEPIKFNREERRLIVLDGEPIDFKHTHTRSSLIRNGGEYHKMNRNEYLE